MLSSTSIHATWEQPALPNGIVVGYGLIQKTGGTETVLFSGKRFNFTVTNLQPFTVYEFRVNASTVAGSGFSEWTQVTTLEDGKFFVSCLFLKIIQLEYIMTLCCFSFSSQLAGSTIIQERDFNVCNGSLGPTS